jgi:hypothetical protein
LIATDDMTAAKRMHKSNFVLSLIIIAVDVFTLEFDEMFLHLILLISNIDETIIKTLFFMNNLLLFLILIKSVILVSHW